MAPRYLKWTPTSSSTLVTYTWNSSTFWSSQTMSPCRHCVRRLTENQKGFAPIFFFSSSSFLGKWGQKERVAKSEEGPLGRESLLEDQPANDRLLVRQTISQSLCTTPTPSKILYLLWRYSKYLPLTLYIQYRHICFPCIAKVDNYFNLNAFSGFNCTGSASRRRSS